MGSTPRRFDFQVGGKGFLLARISGGRSWDRSGTPDTPSRRSDTDTKYGQLPDELDHPEVWEDWSGGYGHAYRRNGEPTYHWGENFDGRFPRQLVHCQIPRAVADGVMSYGGAFYNKEISHIIEGPPVASSSPAGQGCVYVCRNKGDIPAMWRLTPTGLGTEASAFYGSVVGALSDNYRIEGRPAIWGEAILVADAASSLFQSVSLHANTGAQSAQPGPTVGYVTVGNRLWRSHGPLNRPLYVRNSADGGAWSATYNIGNGYNRINDMIGCNDQLVVGVANGLYMGDETGTFINVIGELTNQIHEDNCRDLTIHNGKIIAQHVAGVFALDANSYSAEVKNIGPNMSHRSPIQGMVRCLRSFGGWLYGGLWTGSQSYLLAGEETPSGVTWHTQQRLPHVAKVNRLHVDGITVNSGGVALPNRMWIATDVSINTGGTAPLYYYQIPRLNGNPLMQDPVFSPNYIGSARMDLGSVDWGAPSTPKFYRSVEVTADMLLSGYRYCDVYYDVDQSGQFKMLGRAQTSPKTTLYFPAADNNMVVNPSGEDAGGYTAVGATVEFSTIHKLYGDRSYHVSPAGNNQGIAITLKPLANIPYYVSFYWFGGVTNKTIDLDGSTTHAFTLLETGDKFNRYGAAIPATEANGSTTLRLMHTTGAGTDWYIDGIQVEPGTAPSAYSEGVVSGQSIELSLRSFTASPALTPIYRSIVLRGALRPRSVDQIIAVARVADNMRDRQGGEMRSAATMIQELRDLANPGKTPGPVELIDLTGAVSYVTVLPPVAESEMYQKGEDAPEVAAQVRMSIMSFSAG